MSGLLNTAHPQSATPHQAPVQPGQQATMQPPSNTDSAKRMDALQGLVLAGKKVLYAPEMKGKLLSRLDPGNPSGSAAEVAATVMLLLVQKAPKGIDPSNVVPAGIVLVGDLLDVLEKAHGVTLDDQISEDAIGAFVNHMLEAFPDHSDQQPQQHQQQQPQPQPQPGLLGGAA